MTNSRTVVAVYTTPIEPLLKYAVFTLKELIVKYKAKPVDEPKKIGMTSADQAVIYIGTCPVNNHAVFIKLAKLSKEGSTKPSKDKHIQKYIAQQSQSLDDEVQAMRRVKDVQGVIKLIEAVRIEEHCQFAIISKLVQGTSMRLLSHKGKTWLKKQEKLLLQLLPLTTALNEMHIRGILHGDLKAENIVYDEKTDSSVFVDLGFAVDMIKRASSQPFGQQNYMDPAFFAMDRRYDAASETYGIACSLVETILKEDIIDPVLSDALSSMMYDRKRASIISSLNKRHQELCVKLDELYQKICTRQNDQEKQMLHKIIECLKRMIEPVRVLKRPTLESIINVLENDQDDSLDQLTHDTRSRKCKERHSLKHTPISNKRIRLV